MISVLKKKLNKKGFTLAELLIVVGIIAVLAAIAMPVFGDALEKAETARDFANVRAAYSELLVDKMLSAPTEMDNITITRSELETQSGLSAGNITISGQEISVNGHSFTVDDDVILKDE